MDPIDLRSDTVTRPTAAMREAMARAEVGDDVFGEDPTVHRLQERAAELLGKEAALFFPSGPMANQAALRSLTRPGDVVLAGQSCHILLYEGGAAWALAGLHVETIGRGGLFEASDVLAHVRTDADPHASPTTLVAVENTHNSAGGRVFPLAALREIGAAARSRGLALHMDGARLWNAAVATGVPAAEYAAPFDTVSFCLSKGLGAPVGSLVCTTRERLHRLLRVRKMLGGGMRQVGVLAAAGLHALEHHVERLAEDHANARRLAAGLRELGLDVEGEPETNIVMFRAKEGADLVRALTARGVQLIPFSETRFRAVTHLDVSADRIDEALERTRAALEEVRRKTARD